MVRVGPAAYQSAQALAYVRPMQFAGRPVMGYVLVAPDGYVATTALATWVQRGIDFVSTLPAV